MLRSVGGRASRALAYILDSELTIGSDPSMKEVDLSDGERTIIFEVPIDPAHQWSYMTIKRAAAPDLLQEGEEIVVTFEGQSVTAARVTATAHEFIRNREIQSHLSYIILGTAQKHQNNGG